MTDISGDYSNKQVVWKTIFEGPRWAGFSTQLKDACFLYELDLDIEIDKGWILETVRFKVTGPENKVRTVQNALRKSIDEYNAEVSKK